MMLHLFLSQSFKVHVAQWTGQWLHRIHDSSLNGSPTSSRLNELMCPVDWLFKNAFPTPSLSNPLLSCWTEMRQLQWDEVGKEMKTKQSRTLRREKNKITNDVNFSRDPGILRSLQRSSDSEDFCSFSCWLKTFVLFTCTVNAVHPLMVGEIKKSVKQISF